MTFKFDGTELIELKKSNDKPSSELAHQKYIEVLSATAIKSEL